MFPTSASLLTALRVIKILTSDLKISKQVKLSNVCSILLHKDLNTATCYAHSSLTARECISFTIYVETFNWIEQNSIPLLIGGHYNTCIHYHTQYYGFLSWNSKSIANHRLLVVGCGSDLFTTFSCRNFCVWICPESWLPLRSICNWVFPHSFHPWKDHCVVASLIEKSYKSGALNVGVAFQPWMQL